MQTKPDVRGIWMARRVNTYRCPDQACALCFAGRHEPLHRAPLRWSVLVATTLSGEVGCLPLDRVGELLRRFPCRDRSVQLLRHKACEVHGRLPTAADQLIAAQRGAVCREPCSTSN